MKIAGRTYYLYQTNLQTREDAEAVVIKLERSGRPAIVGKEEKGDKRWMVWIEKRG